ncbi:MAG: DUF3754 domain-containing protein [Thermoguttaceae bacterium]|nr:DUF3754 domain-containing protein [Thermoguttaceae bacterium]
MSDTAASNDKPQKGSFIDRFLSRLSKGVDYAKLNLNFTSQREHFIPIRYEVMLDKILERSTLSDQEKEEIRYLGLMFEEHYHLDYHQDFLKLKDAFAPFNPDKETVYELEFTEDDKVEKRKVLIDGIRKFLEVSNYRLMSQEDFNKCLTLQPFGGLSVQVDTKHFKEFNVFYRGIREVEVTDTFFWLLKHKRKTLQFCRIFVLAEYKTNPTDEEVKEMKARGEKPIFVPEEQAGSIIAKQFRDVPIEHLKIVAPEVKLNLPLFDKFKVGGTFFAGFGTAILKLIYAAAFSLVVFIVLLVGIILAFLKGIFGFLNSRTKCMKKFSENLYHKSLSNNVAAVNMLLDQAETQEVKEALMAYYILYIHRDRNLTMKEMDDYAEAELLEAFNFDIDFEEDDALRKLIEKELVTVLPGETEETTRYKVLLPIKAALQQLDSIWDNYHTVE